MKRLLSAIIIIFGFLTSGVWAGYYDENGHYHSGEKLLTYEERIEALEKRQAELERQQEERERREWYDKTMQRLKQNSRDREDFMRRIHEIGDD